MPHPKLRVSFLGPLGTYSHQATDDFFGVECELVPQDRIVDVFSSVMTCSTSFGIVPIENSSIGGVVETLQALRTTDLSVRGMIALRIGHALLGKPGRSVMNEALGQCAQYLRSNYPQAEIVRVHSTALAAQKVVDDPEKALAVCSPKCADVYGLDVVDRDIQDGGRENTTRFVVLSLSNVPLPEAYPIASRLRGFTDDIKA